MLLIKVRILDPAGSVVRADRTQDLTDIQRSIWRDMNQPSYSHFREYGLISKAEQDTLSWLKESGYCVSDESRSICDAFFAWKRSASSDCLLVTGPPGQGKSVLTGSILDHLDETMPISQATCKVIYHFCSIKVEAGLQTAEFVLRTLIVQLCNDRRLFDQLPSTLRANSKSFHTASLNELQTIFGDLILASTYERVYCVIDGLDVYLNGMENLVSLLKKLYESCKQAKGLCLKLFCTSRPEQSILDLWDPHPKVILRPDRKDLTAFIQSSVQSLPDRFDNRMRLQLLISLQERTGQTFLWISIIVKEIRRLRMPTIGKIKETIDRSPQGLDDLYRGLVADILQSDSRLVLVWVVYANRPLTLAELSDAVAVDPHKKYEYYKDIEEYRPALTTDSVHSGLGTLVDVLHDTVHVIHQSLRDFFLRVEPLRSYPFLGDKLPRLLLAETCMIYLALEDFNKILPVRKSKFYKNDPGLSTTANMTSEQDWGRSEPYQTLEKTYPLLHYAARNWQIHIKQAEEVTSFVPTLIKITDGGWKNAECWFHNIVPCSGPTNPWEIAIKLDIQWLAELLLTGKMQGYDNPITPDITTEVFRELGPKVLRSSIEFWGEHIQPSREMLLEAMDRATNEAAALVMLDKWGHRVRFDENIVANVLGLYPDLPRSLTLLLERHGLDFRATERPYPPVWYFFKDSLAAAMEQLLDRCGSMIRINEEILENMVCNYAIESESMLTMLLDRRGNEIAITENILEKVVSDTFEGASILTLILDQRGSEIIITENIVEKVVSNEFLGEEMLAMLQDLRGSELRITESILEKVVSNNCSGEGMLAMLLDLRGSEVRITESILEKVVSNNYSGKRMLAMLLDLRGSEVRITESILEKVVSNNYSGKRMLAMLLDQRGSEVRITEKVLEKAVSNPSQGDKMLRLLLNQRNDEIKSTENVLKALVTKRAAERRCWASF